MSHSPPCARASWLKRALPLLIVAAAGAGLLAGLNSPDVQVQDGAVVVPLGGTVDFGTAAAGAAASKTFTVTNTGTAPLNVAEAIAVPPGFTLMASFPGVPTSALPTNVPAYTIAPSASATFTVALNSATAGVFAGSVSFQNDVAGKSPFTFQVTGKVLPPPSERIVDDADPGFGVVSGSWFLGFVGQGWQNTVGFAAAGDGSSVVAWTFPNLQPGQYRVSTTWYPYSNRATNAPYTVLDGSTALGTTRLNQQLTPNDFGEGGSGWKDVGVFTLAGNTLTVRLSNDADQYVIADAVRVERVGYPGTIINDSQVGSGFGTTGSWEYFIGQGLQNDVTFTAAGDGSSAACWTFTNVVPGQYRVATTWSPYSNRATNAPYTVLDGSTPVGTVRVNQQLAPNDFQDAGIVWKDLGFVAVTGNTLTVSLSNDADQYVIADAVRIERVNAPTVPSTADTVRLLEQATWGPSSALVTQVQGLGFAAWLDQQFTAAATSYPTLPLYNTNDNVTNNVTTSCYGDPNVSGNPARSACLRDHYSMYPLQNQFFTNALYGGDQLRQRVAWGLHKIWVISGVDVRQSAWVAPYLQILSSNALGNYRTLMGQITLNAGMGNYLNMAGSSKAAPNENYPRELMQLFTIGLTELNPDGSAKTDANGPIATYNQALVNNVTRVFTGWNFAPAPAPGVPDYIDPMRLGGQATENPVNHDFGAKTLLRGFVQPARTSSVANAYADLNEGLDNIYAHPNLGPFVCKQLIQQLVTSNPTPGYVARVVDTFNRNKANANQMREVLKAILLDPEARGDRKDVTNYGHLREPVLYINNLMRLFDAKSADRTKPSDGYLNPDAVNQGQDTFRPPSVFSYFSPFKVAVGGNPPVLGPEFQLLTTSTVLRRANFVNQSVTPNSTRTIDVVRAAGTTPSGTDPATGLPLVPTGPFGTAVDVSSLASLAANPSALADELSRLMLHGTMTPEMKADVVTAVTAVASNNPTKRVRTAVYLVASSMQYQVQR